MRHQSLSCLAILALTGAASEGQLVTAYTGDEQGEKSWLIDVATGENAEGPFGKSRALASDPATDRIFEIEPIPLGSSSVRLSISSVDDSGDVSTDSTTLVFDESGDRIRIITSLAYGNGTLYAYNSGSGPTDPSLGVIDPDTGTFTTILTNEQLPIPQDGLGGYVRGLTFDTDRNRLLLGVRDGTTTNSTYSVYVLYPDTGDSEPLVSSTGSFDGLAYGRGRIYLDCGAPCGPLQVFNTLTGQFEANLTLPRRTGNGSGGATFLEALAPIPLQPCLADVNGDGIASPADFTAWIQAFNTRSSACDQNGDGACNPSDFSSWVINFNAGCP
ncbi:MAG: GC-type dockerin domain-anchored protein [Planctomycetota bacterium]